MSEPEIRRRSIFTEGQGVNQTLANIAAAQAAMDRGQGAGATISNYQQAIAAAQNAQRPTGRGTA
jgi:hypothetical protein